MHANRNVERIVSRLKFYAYVSPRSITSTRNASAVSTILRVKRLFYLQTLIKCY
jgi:hypothetical protein